MYPKVYEDYRKFTDKFGDLSVLPTKYFLNRPEIGEEFQVELEKGKVLILKLLAIGPLSDQTGQREVFYEMNGEVRQVTVDDNHAAVENKSRPKADSSDSSQVGAPMSGVVVEVRAKDGNDVQKGDPIAVLSAMKMVSPKNTIQILYCDHNANKWSNRKWLSPPLTLARLVHSASRRVTPSTVRT
jgi:pyruvate carboxylase